MSDTSLPPIEPVKPPAKRRRLDAAGAREAILAAAESLLINDGPDGLRLTEVATKAGVSHPNVLYHFGSVAELQAQLAQRVAVRLADEVASVFKSDGGFPITVDNVVSAVFEVFDERGFARLLAWLVLAQISPGFDALGAKLELLRTAIAMHPALRGEEHAERRKRLVPAIELVIVSAVGYGLVGKTVESFFRADSSRLSVSQLLGSMLTPGPRQSETEDEPKT
jgi:AcrR family transcriptional regulator